MQVVLGLLRDHFGERALVKVDGQVFDGSDADAVERARVVGPRGRP
jgi:hypothetical protein